MIADTGYRKACNVIAGDWLREQGRLPHRLTASPASLFEPVGWKPDEWQLHLLRSKAPQTLVLCPRQVGKSLSAAAKALITALTKPRSLSVIISRSQHQAAEVLLKVKILHAAYMGHLREARRLQGVQWQPSPITDYAVDEEDSADATTVRDNRLSKEFANGSRIETMACRGETAVGNTTDLLILDEAARMPDQVYMALRPTLAIAQSAGKGELLVLSTPFGKRGWFWEAWKSCEDAKAKGNNPDWAQVSIKVEQCPRITPQFLASEERAMGRHWYQQEYLTIFRDAIDSVFSGDDVDRAVVNTGEPLQEAV